MSHPWSKTWVWIRHHPIRSAAIAAAVVVVGLVIYFSRNSPDLWPVAIPGLLTGIGTLALAYGTFSVVRGDQRDRRDREDRELRDQASRIHPGVPQLATVAAPGGSRYGSLNNLWQVEVANDSEYPIRRIETWIIETWANVDLAIQKDEPPTPIARSYFEQLQPHEKRDMPFYDLQFATSGERHRPVSEQSPPPLVAVTFTDSNGRRWLRDPNWRIHEVTGNSERVKELISWWVQTPPVVARAQEHRAIDEQ